MQLAVNNLNGVTSDVCVYPNLQFVVMGGTAGEVGTILLFWAGIFISMFSGVDCEAVATDLPNIEAAEIAIHFFAVGCYIV